MLKFNACQSVFSYFIKLEAVSQFERFHPHHVQMVNKTKNILFKLIHNNAEAGTVNRNTLWF